MTLNKQWKNRHGSGTAYDAASTAPEDQTPADAAGMLDLEERINAEIAAEASARSTAVNARQLLSEKDQANGYPGLSAGGFVVPARLGSGVRDGTKFLRDDGSWQPLPAQSGSVIVVDAGTDLDTARPSGAAAVYWMFDSGVDVGASGVNITNVVAGDLIFVAA